MYSRLLKIFLLGLLVAAFPSLRSVAQGTLGLKNGTDYWLHYVVDPAPLKAFPYTDSDFSARVNSYFLRSGSLEEFSALPPGKEILLPGSGVGEHLLIGFFVVNDKSFYPVKVLGLPVREGVTSRYTVYNTASGIHIPRDKGILENFVPVSGSGTIIREIKLDNRYSDWAAIPVTAGFSTDYVPEHFIREREGIRHTLAIENSLFWQHGGTKLETFKALRDDFYFYFQVTAFDAITSDFMLYFYLYPTRENIPLNPYALEFRSDPAGDKGTVWLWNREGGDPVEIGGFLYTDRYLESRVEWLLFPEAVRYNLRDYSFDLASCYYNSVDGSYEEFYCTSVYFRDIPHRIDLLP